MTSSVATFGFKGKTIDQPKVHSFGNPWVIFQQTWLKFGILVHKSSRSQMFFKIDVLKDFTNFTGQQL